METLELPCDGSCKWAGMGDYDIRSPNDKVSIIIKYVGEPPHGDSYHSIIINKRPFPGYVWVVFLHFRVTLDIWFVVGCQN